MIISTETFGRHGYNSQIVYLSMKRKDVSYVWDSF